MERQRMQAWRLLLEVHSHITTLLADELEAECDLPLTWYDVLVQLQEAPCSKLRMQELARAVLLSKSGLTRLIDRMSGEGLVERELCPEDRRGQFVVLTTKGLERLNAAAPIHMRGVDQYFADALNGSQAAGLRDALEAVRVRVEAGLAARERS